MRISATLFCLLPILAWANDPMPVVGPSARPLVGKMSGYAEAGLARADLSANLSSWSDAYVKGHAQLSPRDGVFGEVSSQRHFGDRGTFVGAGWTHVFDEAVYGSLSLGTSEGGFFLPRLRVDGALFYKWLERRNLVTGATLGYYRAKDVHHDESLLLNAVYYFEGPWIVEGGVRVNWSHPGSVTASRAYAAVTYGRNKERYLVLRHESGREAYQLVAAATAVADFTSSETTITWREWLGKNTGLNLSAAWYDNPTYQRTGLAAGIFHDF